MADPLRFHPLVAEDLAEAMGWYSAISTELSSRFRERIDKRFDEIAGHPMSFPLAFDDVRFARVARFPYLVLFRPLGPVIRVVGVFHTASDPAKWRQRSRS